jgi:haloalkane dehalogenase
MKSTIELPYATGLTLSNLEKALAKAGEQTDGLAIQSVLAQFFGDTEQPHTMAAIRAWTAGLFDSLDEQGALIDSRALGHLEVPVWVVFGETDRYLNPSLAAG